MTKRSTFWLLMLICFLSSLAWADEMTISTYYPAPYGVYREFITTNNTYLATDGGNVGIGTTTPAAKLTIDGGSSNALSLLIRSSGPGFGSGIVLENYSTGTGTTGRTYSIYSGQSGILVFGDETAGAVRMLIDDTAVRPFRFLVPPKDIGGVIADADRKQGEIWFQ